jgi:hypothetical protein
VLWKNSQIEEETWERELEINLNSRDNLFRRGECKPLEVENL